MTNITLGVAPHNSHPKQQSHCNYPNGDLHISSFLLTGEELDQTTAPVSAMCMPREPILSRTPPAPL